MKHAMVISCWQYDENYDRALTIVWSSLAVEPVSALRKGYLAYTLTLAGGSVPILSLLAFPS